MVANPSGNSGGNLGGGDFHDAVAEGNAFAGGYGNACKGQEYTVGADNLAKLRFVYV